MIGTSSMAENFKDGVPQIKTTTIPKDKIGALIGTGRKKIKLSKSTKHPEQMQTLPIALRY